MSKVRNEGEQAVLTNLPKRLPVMREEFAIWRAFLAAEIDMILHGETHAAEADGELSC